eukprot:9100882-Prorocentrum_lima.AAC.1
MEGRGQWVLSVEEGCVRAGQRLGDAEAAGRGLSGSSCLHITSALFNTFLLVQPPTKTGPKRGTDDHPKCMCQHHQHASSTA